MTTFIVALIIGLLIGWAIPQPAFVQDWEGRFFRWFFAYAATKAAQSEPVANTEPSVTANNASANT